MAMKRRSFLSMLAAAVASPLLAPLAKFLPTAPLADAVDLRTGISIRFIKKYDVVAGPFSRLDVLYGVPNMMPLACPILNEGDVLTIEGDDTFIIGKTYVHHEAGT